VPVFVKLVIVRTPANEFPSESTALMSVEAPLAARGGGGGTGAGAASAPVLAIIMEQKVKRTAKVVMRNFVLIWVIGNSIDIEL
jgi:hypothetical protein